MQKISVEEKQEMVYQAIKDYWKKNKISPTLRELCAQTGIRSTATLQKYLLGLQESGRLTYIAKTPRSIILTETQNEKTEHQKTQMVKAEVPNTEGEVVYHATIELTPITKKNSQEIRINYKTGARWIAPSKQYEKYAKNAQRFLTEAPRIDYPVNVQMEFYMPTRRKVDLSNLQNACLDILVDNGIIEDDNCNIVVSHDGSRVVLPEEKGQFPPHTEITIRRVDENDKNNN